MPFGCSMVSLPGNPLIRSALVDPTTTLKWSLMQWDLCLRQAIRADVAATLASRCRQTGVLTSVPAAPRRHLESAQVIAAKHVRDVAFELQCIDEALKGLSVPIVVLKGAAYRLAGLPFAASRVFSDVDILVPHCALGDVEAALFRSGWVTAPLDAYDQSYYREFTHELPPMMHAIRGTTIDVHHTILPPTARARPDPSVLIRDSIPASGSFHVLAPRDMLLHSATHLFHEGEFEHGFRDLWDLKSLFELFATVPDFQQQLNDRALAFGLDGVLNLARRYVQRFFNANLHSDAAANAWLDMLFDRGLAPNHPSCADRFSPVARFALFVRGHWMRMPPHILIPHLTVKALKRLRRTKKGEHAYDI